MKQPAFRIVPLPTAVADAAQRALAAGVADHALVTADAPNAFPCRHCLQWATPGEQMVLFPYASVAAGAYRESGPIFVHAQSCERYVDVHAYPEQFCSGRVIRAYDTRGWMIDACVVNGSAPEAVIEELLENPEATFLHVRSATRGCYTMGVERV